MNFVRIRSLPIQSTKARSVPRREMRSRQSSLSRAIDDARRSPFPIGARQPRRVLDAATRAVLHRQTTPRHVTSRISRRGQGMDRIVIALGFVTTLTSLVACDKLKKEDEPVQLSTTGVTAPGVTVT